MTVRGVPPAYRPAGEGRPPFAERLAVGIHGGLPLSPDGLYSFTDLFYLKVDQEHWQLKRGR